MRKNLYEIRQIVILLPIDKLHGHSARMAHILSSRVTIVALMMNPSLSLWRTVNSMEYRNNNPAHTDDAAFCRMLAAASSGNPCSCVGQNMPESANGRRIPDRGRPMVQNPSMNIPQAIQKEACDTNDCENAQKTGSPLRGFPLAMVYSPEQEWQETYTQETALSHGTLFPSLHFPWYPAACDRGCGREVIR